MHPNYLLAVTLLLSGCGGGGAQSGDQASTEPSTPAPQPQVPLIPAGSSAVLVDFTASSDASRFSADYPSWRQLLTGSAVRSTQDAEQGLYCASEAQAQHCYAGIQGEQAIGLSYGDRIEVTWYNRGTTRLKLDPLVSFVDSDGPQADVGAPQWYAMSYGKLGDSVYIDAGAQRTSYYEIIDGSRGETFALSAGNYQRILVSPGLNSSSDAMIQQIALIRGLDIEPPTPVPSLTLVDIHASAAQLQWEAATDEQGVSLYAIYRDGLQIGETAETNYLDFGLSPDRNYQYTVVALDPRRNAADPSPTLRVTTPEFDAGEQLIDPNAALAYLGAFKLTAGQHGESRWEYGGQGITYYPHGDPENTDPYPGSLFITGDIAGASMQRFAAEVAIPEPQRFSSLDALNAASTVAPQLSLFHDVTQAFDFSSAGGDGRLPLLPIGDLAYLPAQSGQSTDKIYLLYAGMYHNINKQHFGAFEPDFSQFYGGWWFASTEADYAERYRHGQFLTAVPAHWAAQALKGDAAGKLLLAGNYKAGGGGGQGISLYFMAPWQDGSPLPEHNAVLQQHVVALGYDPLPTNQAEAARYTHSMHNFSKSDYFYGAAWLSRGDRHAVALIGNKAYGRTWYGYSDGTEFAQVARDVPKHDTSQLNADKGWRASVYKQQLYLFDPQQLAAVANGEIPSYQPQPYAVFDLEPFLFRKQLKDKMQGVGSMTFDPERGYLYVLEREIEGDFHSRPVVHVFSLNQ